jgi:hypothetical protein
MKLRSNVPSEGCICPLIDNKNDVSKRDKFALQGIGSVILGPPKELAEFFRSIFTCIIDFNR